MNYEQSLSRFVNSVKAIEQDDNDAEPLSGNIDPYRVNRRLSASAVLKNNFPTTEKLLGGKIFSALSQVYAKIYPSSWWDINVLGSEFPDFLQTQTKSPKASEFDWALIAEIATLEYAIIDRYYYPGHASTEDNVVQFSRLNFNSFTEIFRSHPQLVVSYIIKESENSPTVLTLDNRLDNDEVGLSVDSENFKEVETLRFQSARVFREKFQISVEFLCVPVEL